MNKRQRKKAYKKTLDHMEAARPFKIHHHFGGTCVIVHSSKPPTEFIDLRQDGIAEFMKDNNRLIALAFRMPPWMFYGWRPFRIDTPLIGWDGRVE